MIRRSNTGFISFVGLEISKIITVVEPQFNFQIATQGVKIYSLYLQDIFSAF
jgi:hypothetical protein